MTAARDTRFAGTAPRWGARPPPAHHILCRAPRNRHANRGYAMTEAAQASREALTPSQALRLDRACNAFEAAWRECPPPRIEDALAGWSEPGRSALLRELVHLEVYHRRARGED